MSKSRSTASASCRKQSLPHSRSEVSLGDQDIRQIQAHGLTPEQVHRQLHFFAKPPRFIRLARAARVHDGIQRLPLADRDGYLHRQAEAARQGRFLKFVPASGGATRMFELLLHYFYHVDQDITAVIDAELAQGMHRAREFVVFHDCLSQFAFYPELQNLCTALGNNLEDLLAARARRMKGGGFAKKCSCRCTCSGVSPWV